ncbi:hypothetical protein N7471_001477 [Penicillium samsonianum]|uniref:uncharacterized protein n=1 Tax=Penicillium samsonianum TaxID=1882272 RepID=UPI0025491553|nr:uncharacterized protein N7471_001477 [Penicillium samsonianum]KAJ6150278.1 hypothetical protein N7471_001477 [Penicillium samsonianum]
MSSSSHPLGSGLGTTPSSQVPHPRKTHVLLLLVLEGNAKQVVHDFEKLVENLPAKLQAKITDAYETNASAGVFLRMTWEAYARILSTVELEPLLPVIGLSLVRTQELREVPVLASRENISFQDRPQDKT